MIKHFFATENHIDVTQLHDYVHSPADVVSACMAAKNWQGAVQLLIEQDWTNVNVNTEERAASTITDNRHSLDIFPINCVISFIVIFSFSLVRVYLYYIEGTFRTRI